MILGTSAPNRFKTTQAVLSFFYKHNIITKFEVDQCSIHLNGSNGQIMLRFGTVFSAQLFTLKLQINDTISRYFQINHLSFQPLEISQYVTLNLCVQRRSRDGKKFGHIIRRWRSEAIIDCNADRRQFYLYVFKENNINTNKGNQQYIKLSIDDRILEKI